MSRAYFLVSPYLSNKQKGIQTAHTVAEMFSNARNRERTILNHWANEDKTIVMLSYGFDINIIGPVLLYLEDHDIVYNFFEERELNDSITCIGFIPPDFTVVGIDNARRLVGSKYYTQDFLKDNENPTIKDEVEFCKIIASMSLA